jgi:hypothetical protein
MLGITIALALLCLSTLTLKSYQLVSLTITEKQDISRLTRLHENIKVSAIQPTNNDVSELALFGVPPVVLINSHFTLLGIGYSQKNPTVIIGSDENKNGDIYRVNDKLPEGAIVSSIGKDYVILLFNGSTEKLSLQWEQKPHDQ